MFGQRVVAAEPPTVAERVEAPAPPAGRLRARKRNMTPYLLILPTALFLAVFFVWPMVQALLLAFQDDSGALTTSYLHRMSSDPSFWPAIRNTLLLIIVVVPLQTVLALAMALLLQNGLRGTSFFLYVWAIPLAISDLAAGVVWLAIFTDRGYLNSILNTLGVSENGFAFLSPEHPATTFLAVVIAESWRATSLVMVILLAGVQVIPKDYGEAAEVFGATFWQRLRYVTLPMLRPSLQVALILRTILAFQIFSVVLALAGRNLLVLTGEAYNWYGSLNNRHVAAAYSLVILGASMLITFVYLRALRVSDEQLGM